LLGWSQDAKGLLFKSFPAGKTKAAPTETVIFKVAIENGVQQPITTFQSAYFYNINLSPDRKMIALALREEGKDNLWVIPANGGTAKKITANNNARLYFSSLAWSSDGKEIFFGKQSRYSLLSMLSNFK
jgi:tricorn protease